MFIEVLKSAAAICGYISSIAVIVVAISKKVREWLFGMKEIKDGQKCLLRSEMLKIYYDHNEEKTIRQHSRENFDYLYNAYKALDGNSFIDDIYSEVREWAVRT